MTRETALQIVATIGPSSRGLAVALRDAGATAFRLNASHMRLEDLASLTAEVCQTLPDFPAIVDLQGAKMRLGLFAERPLRAGERIRFALSASGQEIPLPHKEIFAAVAVGDTLGCDDDRLRFRVLGVSADALETVAPVGGTLRPRKGVNVLEHPVLLTDLSEFDQTCIRMTSNLGNVGFAFSFMKDGSEADWIRRRAPDCSIVGKVERREATENVHRIASAVDAIWICRGDLGAQLGPAAMARWVSAYDPRQEPSPVLMAGQVLEHLTTHAAPTRSEVCHLFDLVTRGYSGFVLSDETAIGVDPIGAVRVLRSLLEDFSQRPTQ
jgi:pyruvate kinase